MPRHERAEFDEPPPPGRLVQPTEGPTDDDLMVRLALGDESSLELLMQRHDLLGYLSLHCPAGVDAADLAQEVWLAVFRNASRYPRGQFRPWLLTAARNAARAEKRRRRVRWRFWAGAEDVQGAFEPAVPPEARVNSDRLEALQGCLGQLSEPDQNLVRDHIAGNPWSVVAEKYGLAVEAAKSRWRRRLGELRACMGGKG